MDEQRLVGDSCAVSKISIMQQANAIAQRFREVTLNGTWIANTNFRHQLEGLPLAVANAKLQSFNTIAVLAQHLHYYVQGVKTVLKGGSLTIRDQFSFDFPTIRSQDEWEAFLTLFWADAEEFASLVEGLPEETLDDVFVDQKYGTYRRNLDGLIEHAYYHLGQVVLLKKYLTTQPGGIDATANG